MISPEQFVAMLQERDLVSADMVIYLKKQIAQSREPTPGAPLAKPLTAPAVAKWLVDNGYLSRLLAQRLLDRAQDLPEKPAAPAPPSAPPPPPETKPPAAEAPKRPSAAAAATDDDLGLAPLDEDEPALAPLADDPPAPRGPAGGDYGLILEDEAPPAGPGLVPLDESGLIPLDEPAPAPRPRPARPAAPAPQAPVGSVAAPAAKAAPGARLDELLGGDGAQPAQLAPTAPAVLRRKSVWDTPLILVGGGALLFLVLLLCVLAWALTRGSADQKLSAANDFYTQGSYSSAIRNYGEYLEQYPSHTGVGLARVRIGLARLRQQTEGAKNWPEALKTAQEVVPQMSSEKEFAGEARPELASLLPDIAAGLAADATEKLDSARVAQSRKALALVEKYVPSSMQPLTKLQDTEATLALADRAIARDAELAKAIAAMDKAAKAGRPTEAYQVRSALLRTYPDLAANEKLVAAVMTVSQAERDAVEFVAQANEPQKDEPASPIARATALASVAASASPPGTAGHVIFVEAEGATYGLDAEKGTVLWRRATGIAVNGHSLGPRPIAVDNQPGGDGLLLDSARQELVRVAGKSGQIVWRSPLGERSDTTPVVVGGTVLLAARSGRLLVIDAASGAAQGHIQLPHELRVPPAYWPDNDLVYQVTDHTNLFVINMAKRQCQEVVYLGHEPSTINVPPVVLSPFLLIAENSGAESSRLRVLTLRDSKGKPAVLPVQEIALRGHVDVAPYVAGVRVGVTTDQGDVHIFEVSAADPEKPLVAVAQGKAAGGDSPAAPATAQPAPARFVHFPLLSGARLWLADSQLTRYDVIASGNRLQPKGIENARSAALLPPWLVGEAVVHVRREADLPGVVVSAERVDGGDPYWETRLAAPLAATPTADVQTGKLTAVTSAGGVFQFDASADTPAGTIEPVALASPADASPGVSEAISLPGGAICLPTTAGPKQLLVFDAASPGSFRRLVLPDAVGVSPIALGTGLLVPCRAGQAFLLDMRTGQKLAEPFQPPLRPNVAVAWTRPAALGDREFLIADGGSGLYRVGLKAEAKPSLAALNSAELTSPIVAPVAATAAAAFGVTAAGELLAFELPDLKSAEHWTLGGRCDWGPERIGERVLLTTDDGKLYCLAEKSLLWQTALPYGPLAGPPLETEGRYVLASRRGIVWRVDASTGQEQAKIDTGVALGSGPILVGSRLYVGGSDGSLLAIKAP